MRKQVVTKRSRLIFDTKGAKGRNKDLRKSLLLVSPDFLKRFSSSGSIHSLSAKPPSMDGIGSGGEDDKDI